MRLIDARTIELVEFIEESAPVYAVLSHRWEEDEVALQEIQELSRTQWSKAFPQTVNPIRAKRGYTKLERFAELALQHGYDYVWVDTCCIDKTSSAELSEAINSMHRWYQNAAVCFAYLSDVKHGDHDAKVEGGGFYDLCSKSKWFTRGWTLQELVAPAEVRFYDGNWKYLGSKENDQDVRASLNQITGIHIRVLDGSMQISEASVAERMQWAANRRTSRAEDTAYSLLGIFDVNMPLLYGEGGVKAFIRLQEEILRSSNDHTIFAWSLPDAESNTRESLHGLLATHPRYFSGVTTYRPLPPVISKNSTAWSTTNQGMRLSILLQPKNEPDGGSDGEYLAILECSRRVSNDTHWSPAVHVRRLYGDQFARTQAHIIYTVPTPLFGQQTETGRYETVFFKQKPVYPVPDFMISFDNLKDRDNSNAQTWVAEIYPPRLWDSETGILLSVSTGPHKPMFLVRYNSIHLDRSVFLDLVVGLERLPGGAWKPWSLQRLTAEHLSAQESLHQSYGKRNCDPLPDRPGRGGSWQPELDIHVKIKIHEQKLHERVHFLIKAYTYMELPEDTVDPSLPFFIHRTSASSWDAKASTLEAQLQYFLGDFVFNGQLDRGFPCRELPAGHMIRTRSLKSGTELFERSLGELPIRGVNPNEATFLNYCARGNVQGVSTMLQDDPRLKDSVSLDQHKLQPIHWAAAGGHRLVAKQLLSAGASLEARTAADGWTAMHLAALFGHFRCLRLLVFHELRGNIRSLEGSDLLTDRENPFHDSPLHLAMSQVWAAESEAELDALEELTDGAQFSGLMRLWNDFEETPIHRLAACGMNMLARKRGMGELLTHENDAALVNGYADKMGNVLPGYYIDHMGRTILWHATLSGQVEEVKQILEVSRLDVNVSDARGMSPLHVACRFGYTEVVQVLLEAGAWPNCVTNSPGFTPAHYAVLFNHVECLELLIEHGAYIQQGTDSNGFRCKPIHLANANGFQGIRQVLVAAGSSEHDFSCSHLVLNRSQNMETTGEWAQDLSASHDDYLLFGVIPTSSPAGRSLVARSLNGEHTLSKSDFRAITLGIISEEVHASMVAEFPPLAHCHELEGNSLSATSEVEDDVKDNTIGPNEGLMPYCNLAYDLLDWKRRTKDDRNPEQFMFFRDEDGTPEDDVANLGKDTMQSDQGSATNAASASERVERNQAAVVYNGEHWMPDGGVVAEDLLGRGTQEGQAVLEGEYEGDAKEESRAEGFLGTRQPTIRVAAYHGSALQQLEWRR